MIYFITIFYFNTKYNFKTNADKIFQNILEQKHE